MTTTGGQTAFSKVGGNTKKEHKNSETKTGDETNRKRGNRKKKKKEKP